MLVVALLSFPAVVLAVVLLVAMFMVPAETQQISRFGHFVLALAYSVLGMFIMIVFMRYCWPRIRPSK